MARRKRSPRYLSEMSVGERAIYRREYDKSRKVGMDKWTAIRFARSMAIYGSGGRR